MNTTAIQSEQLELRHENVRTFLREHNLGALFAYSPPIEHKWTQTGHVSYLSGWANHDRIVESAVVVPEAGPAALLFCGMNYMREQIAEVSPMSDVRLCKAIDPNAISTHSNGQRNGPRGFAAETLSILDSAGASGKKVGIGGVGAMPMPFYDALKTSLGDQMVRVDDIVSELRAIKTSDEVELLREAARLSDLGYETMLKVARPGMRGIEILAEMEHAVRREGADHAKYWLASGPAPDWADSRLDLKAPERVLDQGDLMASCSYIVYKGYWCHGQRTGTLSKPCSQLNDIYASIREAQDAGLAKMKPGTPIADVGATIRDIGAKYDFDMPGARFGHGIGMDYTELPVPLNDDNDRKFEAGMTLVVHSLFTLPESGKMIVPLGDVCHVTKDGPEFLMKFTRDLFLAGV